MQRGLVFTTSLLLKPLKTVISSALRGNASQLRFSCL